jgi:hypothetical protein
MGFFDGKRHKFNITMDEHQANNQQDYAARVSLLEVKGIQLRPYYFC